MTLVANEPEINSLKYVEAQGVTISAGNTVQDYFWRFLLSFNELIRWQFTPP